jgi:hypothetical protein
MPITPMSLIHIARNNAVLGQYTEEDVRTGLAAGTYLATDLAWRTGLAQWKPLGEWPEFFSQTGTPPPISPGDTHSLDQIDMPSWERRNEIGFFSALIATAKEVLLSPDSTFANMRCTGGFGTPFRYYIIPQAIIGVIMAIFMTIAFTFILYGPSESARTAQQEKLMALFGGFGAVGIGFFCFIAFIVMIPISLFVSTGILHLMLKLWSACNAPFETTFRVVAYTWGTVGLAMFPLQILGLIPCLGIIFSMAAFAVSIWGMVIAIKGLATTHEAPVGRVIGAVLTPVVVCCCLYALIMIAVLAPAMAAGAHH